MRIWQALAAGLATATLVVPVSSPAQEGDLWVKRPVAKKSWDECGWDGTCVRRYRYQYQYFRRPAEGHSRRPEVRGFVHRAPEHDGRGECLALVKAVGDERQSVDKAKEAASRAWAGHVRFHYGEKYIDETNAINVRFTCSRSSVNDTVLGKLQESAGITHTRCQIEARPCRAQAEK
ncbi:MAG: hypothetical protein K2X43_15090 [Hyphomonadaceae bacterium]|jgi:hypothetical protein|nr:hypothetical protein [Hyphomonadaceae bacterium]